MKQESEGTLTTSRASSRTRCSGAGGLAGANGTDEVVETTSAMLDRLSGGSLTCGIPRDLKRCKS
jgi:hypothetical protein